jgi:hypothetical protein
MTYFDRNFDLIARNINANFEAINTFRTVIQRQQLFAMLNDRIRPGATVTFSTDTAGVYGIQVSDPIAEQARASMLSSINQLATNVFSLVPKEVLAVQQQRKFGGEDQVQHAMVTGFLSNITTALSNLMKAFYV